MAAAAHNIATDYGKLDCITTLFMSFFSQNQSLAFWEALLPVFFRVFELHGATLMARENDRFLKQAAFHLLRLAIFRNDNIRKRAVIGLKILVRVRLSVDVPFLLLLSPHFEFLSGFLSFFFSFKKNILSAIYLYCYYYFVNRVLSTTLCIQQG